MLIVLHTGPQSVDGDGASDFEHHYRGFSMNVNMPGIPEEEINPEPVITTVAPKPS